MVWTRGCGSLNHNPPLLEVRVKDAGSGPHVRQHHPSLPFGWHFTREAEKEKNEKTNALQTLSWDFKRPISIMMLSKVYKSYHDFSSLGLSLHKGAN